MSGDIPAGNTRRGSEPRATLDLTARPNCPLSHMAMTSMNNVMLEEEGRRAGAETNMPAEVADKSRNNPPARLSENYSRTSRQTEAYFVDNLIDLRSCHVAIVATQGYSHTANHPNRLIC